MFLVVCVPKEANGAWSRRNSLRQHFVVFAGQRAWHRQHLILVILIDQGLRVYPILDCHITKRIIGYIQDEHGQDDNRQDGRQQKDRAEKCTGSPPPAHKGGVGFPLWKDLVVARVDSHDLVFLSKALNHPAADQV